MPIEIYKSIMNIVNKHEKLKNKHEKLKNIIYLILNVQIYLSTLESLQVSTEYL